MEITDRIRQLKKEKNAVIMAHYYVPGEVQAVADYIGDSYYLSKVAEKLEERMVVFCGVSFMGESAKLLSPDKKVLMPDLCADCPMAHMADKETIQKMRDTYDDLAVVCYINSTTELKQYADVCVTSANAVKIVKALPQKYIFFIPDRNLARHVAGQAPEKTFVYNDGFCPVHEEIRLEEVLAEKERHPEALVLAHPECRKEIREQSDYVGSTSGILRFASESGGRAFIVCTEEGVSHKLRQDNPEKTFYFPKTSPVCTDMKLNTLEKLLHVLEYEDNEVHVPEILQQGAVEPLKKMLELAK